MPQNQGIVLSLWFVGHGISLTLGNISHTGSILWPEIECPRYLSFTLRKLHFISLALRLAFHSQTEYTNVIDVFLCLDWILRYCPDMQMQILDLLRLHISTVVSQKGPVLNQMDIV